MRPETPRLDGKRARSSEQRRRGIFNRQVQLGTQEWAELDTLNRCLEPGSGADPLARTILELLLEHNGAAGKGEAELRSPINKTARKRLAERITDVRRTP